jgi:hypothetical protein
MPMATVGVDMTIDVAPVRPLALLLFFFLNYAYIF